jgi:putative isomerase
LRNLVRDNCWDEASGFYYDHEVATGELRTFVKHVGAFVAMLMGLPTQDQARRMVAHLMNPQEFWTEYPVPVISRDSPDYSPFGNWSGKAWPPTNFFILRGLLNYGFFDEADELLRRWVAQK